MQTIGVEAFSYNRQAQILMVEESDLRGKLDLKPLISGYEHFQVVGHHETKRFMFWNIQREIARDEVGDIIAWEFRPVDRFGRGVDGPKLIVLND